MSSKTRHSLSAGILALCFGSEVWAAHEGKGGAEVEASQQLVPLSGVIAQPMVRAGSPGTAPGEASPPPQPAASKAKGTGDGVEADREVFIVVFTGPQTAETEGERDPLVRLADVARLRMADARVVVQQPYDAQQVLRVVNAEKAKATKNWERITGALFLSAVDITATQRRQDLRGVGSTADEVTELAVQTRDVLFPAYKWEQWIPTRRLETVLVGSNVGQVACPFPAGGVFPVAHRDEKLKAGALATFVDQLERWPHYAFPRTAAAFREAWIEFRMARRPPSCGSTATATLEAPNLLPGFPGLDALRR